MSEPAKPAKPSASGPLAPPITPARVGLLGFGEVGQIFASALAQQGHRVCVWDAAFTQATERAQALRAAALHAGVQATESLADACLQAEWLISAVTASQTLDLALAAAQHLGPGQWLLDLNSASPGTKQQAAAALEACGARYVEAAVMTSVPPYGLAVPMLIGGPHAQAAQPWLSAIGLKTQVASADWGVASATKMCRSIMIKGLEALVVESFTTARRHGVEDAMLATLAETFPGIDWPRQGAYFFSRVAQHGQRRAEEMREAARTAVEAGLGGTMAAAIAERQQSVADAAAAGALQGLDQGLPPGTPWQDYADRLLGHWPVPTPDALPAHPAPSALG